VVESRPDWRARLAALRHRWQSIEGPPVHACVISSAINIAYLTGFRGSAGVLIQDAGSEVLLLDGRYVTVANEACTRGALAAVTIEKADKTYDASMAAVLGRSGVLRVAFEADHVTVSTLHKWQSTSPVEWHGASGLVEELRVIKDAAEVAVLQRAGAALVGVASRLGEWVAAGRSEREIAADINRGLERAGFERPAFDTIVAGGPNSAHPHARPGERRLSESDLVVLDFGGVLDGYCVDLTRMAAVGRLRGDAENLYRAVREAQQAALNVICAGVTAGAVDLAARQVLDSKGLGAAFVHGTGHGLGLEVHEAPRLSNQTGAEVVLRAGMVCTVEPGAYVPGVGGARLEDDVLVTDKGAELLTPGPRDLLAV
jgi:Xaa-Pro aminopeptidase